MIYEEFRPAAPAASRCVESYWRFRADELRDPATIHHLIVPDGLIGIVGHFWGDVLMGIFVTGPSSSALTVDLVKGARAAGVRLRPGVAREMLGVSPAELSGRSEPIAAIAPAAVDWAETMMAGAWREDVLRHFDRAVSDCGCSGDALIRAAGDRIISSWGEIRIADLAREAGLSERHFRDRFAREAGIGPKALARVRRQRAAWIALVTGDAGNLGHASHAAGYADQAHFSREAREIFGLRPAEVRDYVAGIDHRFDWLTQRPARDAA